MAFRCSAFCWWRTGKSTLLVDADLGGEGVGGVGVEVGGAGGEGLGHAGSEASAGGVDEGIALHEAVEGDAGDGVAASDGVEGFDFREVQLVQGGSVVGVGGMGAGGDEHVADTFVHQALNAVLGVVAAGGVRQFGAVDFDEVGRGGEGGAELGAFGVDANGFPGVAGEADEEGVNVCGRVFGEAAAEEEGGVSGQGLFRGLEEGVPFVWRDRGGLFDEFADAASVAVHEGLAKAGFGAGVDPETGEALLAQQGFHTVSLGSASETEHRGPGAGPADGAGGIDGFAADGPDDFPAAGHVVVGVPVGKDESALYGRGGAATEEGTGGGIGLVHREYHEAQTAKCNPFSGCFQLGHGGCLCHEHCMIDSLALIAGKGAYPVELAISARAQGVKRVEVVAFRGETRKDIEQVADEVRWMYVGQLQALLDALYGFDAVHAVMAGQITPSHLFNARLDKPMRDLLRRLPRKNADTIFGAVGDELASIGIELLPASRFMERNLASAGVLTSREPSDQERADMRQGFELAKRCAELQAGQAVAVKRGTVIAVEGFEGTDEMILRAGKVGGEGCVVVKVAQPGHDMRWDIPVVGTTTMKNLRKARCTCLAVEAGRAILLEREALVKAADTAGIAVEVVEAS